MTAKLTNKLFSFALTLALVTILTLSALAQGNGVEGTYTINSASSELGTLTFLLTLKKTDGKWMGEIKDSPMPLTVSTVTVDADNNVIITADAGGTTVEMKAKAEGGKLKGTWTAGDMKGTMEGSKKDAVMATAAPAAVAPAAAASAASLEGTYDAKVVADGQGELPFTLVLKKDGDGYKVEVPNPGDMTVTAIKVDGENVMLSAAYQGNGPIPLNGKIKTGEMGGKWEFSGFAGTWSAVKKK